MSYQIRAAVYMKEEEWNSIPVKLDNVEYIVDFGDRLRSFLGDQLVESLTFEDFTQEQIDIIKSEAQRVCEESARAAEASAASAADSAEAARQFRDDAERYAEAASRAEGFDESASRSASAAALSASSASKSLLSAIAARKLAESYAHGGTGTRDGEDEDNAEFYMRRAQAAAEGVTHDWSYIEGVKNHVDEQSAHVDSVAETTEGYMEDANRAKTAAETAQVKAEDAQGLAEDAQHAAEAAQSAAETAQGKAETAQGLSEQSAQAAAASETNAAASETNAHDSEVAAKTSETNAKTSEINAKASENAAKTSETNAHDSELAAKDSEDAAKDSEDAAKASEEAAALSETNAAASESNANASKMAAAASAAAALVSEQHAKTSETNAANSASAAATSERNASASETDAADSAAAALASEQNAKASETNAYNSEVAAAISEANAHNSEVAAAGSQTAAANSATDAASSASDALDSENAAKTSETNAANSASAAADSEGAAANSETNAAASAKLSESWAVGGTGVRDGENTNNAAYWAEEARKLSPDGKADKVLGGDTDGMVAGLDATGNLTNTNIPSGNVAQKDGYYGKEGLGAATAENLIDPNATPEPASFGFRTAAGDLSITDGKGVMHTQFGSTEIVNQIVAPSSVKAVQGEGVVQVEDAVGGQVKGLVLTAPKSVVLNQQATATQDVTATGDGVAQMENAVAGNATALKMVAPRSVVVNQHISNGNFADGTTGWAQYLFSLSAASNVMTGTLTAEAGTSSMSVVQYMSSTILAGRSMFLRFDIKLPYAGTTTVRLRSEVGGSVWGSQSKSNIAADAWTTVELKWTELTSDVLGVLIYPATSGSTSWSQGDSFQLRNVQLVDLTQYFNGDQTLIDSITSWDDLVTYDPRFANYVEYNTGTVEGVQPTVKVTGKNLFDAEHAELVSSSGGIAISSRSSGTIVANGSTSASNYLIFDFMPIKAEYPVSAFTCSCKVNGNVPASMSNAIYLGTRNNRLCVFLRSGASGDITFSDIQVELGSSATIYEPYHDGGTAQAPTPLLTVGSAADEYEAVAGVTTHKMASVDLGTLNWVYNTSYFGVGLFYTTLPGTVVNNKNIICPLYINNVRGAGSLSDKQLTGVGGAGVYVWIRDDLYTNANDFKAAMSGVPLYYELATPTTSQSTPTTIALQAGFNVAMQTDGGRVASLSATYPATVYDKAILPSRTYLHKHGSTVTKISNQSTVTLDGSDQLVDLTQLFNNDTTAVAAVATWNDLVARVPAYAATLAYNPGVVTGTVPAVKVTGKNLFSDALTSFGSANANWWMLNYQLMPNTAYVCSFEADIDMTGWDQKKKESLCKIVGTNTVFAYPGHTGIVTTGSTGVISIRYSPSLCMYYGTGSIIKQEWHTALATYLQIELGSVATAYEPYFDGGSVTAPSTMYGVGSVADTFDALAGKTNRVIGSYTFTGNETWQAYNVMFYCNIPGKKNGFTNVLMADYVTRQNISQAISNDMSLSGLDTQSLIYVHDTSYTSASACAAGMAGKTIYFERTAPTEESSTPQPVSFQQGDNVIAQSSQDLPGAAISADYDGTEYDLKLVNGSKYVIVDNGVASYRTASSSNNTLPVHGGSTMVHNLTQWFGKGYEPASVDAFYARYPSLNGYAMAYDRGSVLNYKGTAVRTEGFNFYNPATGTARLLGGNQYQICGTYASCSYVDRWGNTEELDIDEEGIFTPVNNGTLTVVGGNATDTCVHLTWSGYRNFGKEEYQWEPFWQVTTPLNVLESFPEGMNGIRSVGQTAARSINEQDELTVNGYVVRIGVIDMGELNWFKETSVTSGALDFRANVPGMRPNSSLSVFSPVRCALYTTEDTHMIVYGGAVDKTIYCFANGSLTSGVGVYDTDYATVEEFKAAMSGVPLYFVLAEPETVTFPETRLITYPVSDFGTEELLPADDAPGIPSTTWLDGRIQYEQDFLRLLINFSKIYSVLKHIADNADRIVYDDDTAPNLIAGNAWNLIDREAKGTMREFSYDSVNGTNDVTDGTAIAQSVHGQTLMANQLVQDSVRKTAQGTGQVEVEDAVAGDVSSLVVEGKSLVKNQLVPPTMTNTKDSTNGRLGITDGVAGNAVGVTLRGGCVVHNQLVKESIEKTVMGTGRLGCDDGVAGNAKSLVMTAPRSVVMNQLVQNGDFSNGLNGWGTNNIASHSLDGNVLTFTANNQLGYYSQNIGTVKAGHVYLFAADINSPYDNVMIQVLVSLSTATRFWVSSTYTGSFHIVSGKYSVTAAGNCVMRIADNNTADWQEVSFRSPMVVDLTQYFNGNTTLINSIQTWDDLVAYDSSFASYVSYNTGTVKGVQPTVKVNHATDVACPVELFGLSNTTSDRFDGVSGVATRIIDSYTFTGNETIVNAEYTTPVGTFAAVFGPSDGSIGSGNASWGCICNKLLGVSYYAMYPGSDALGIAVYARNIYVRVPDTIATDAQGLRTWLADNNVQVYYTRDNVKTEQYTPTTIPMVDIYNSALQTAGTRQCALSLSYDGREQTIALDSAHTYVFLDNMTDSSLVTGQSSIEVVGGEDMLVDVTQLYNGDSSRISQIKRWASLSTRFHRYRELLPYNPGTVEPDTPVVRVFPDEHAYGAVYDPSLSSPTLKWVELNNGVITEKASFEEFSSTPCHDIWRCVMDDLANRHVNYYLDDEDSNKKYNGTRLGVTSDGSASVLTGEDGDVMSRFPVSHWYMDEDYEGEGKVLWLISDRPFMGTWAPSEIHDFFYVGSGGGTPSDQFVGSFKAVICDEDGAALNTTEGALTQATGTAATNKVRSVAGALPYVSVNLDTMEVRARRNGGHMTNTKFLQWLMLLMVIEEGTLNTQAEHAGYSNGIQNAYCFWRKSGRVNAGNGTAEIFADESSQDMDNFQSLKVGSTTVQRDTLRDADGRYAWSVYNRGATSTRYFTASPTPANGDTVYSESTGDTTAGTVSSYTIKAASARAIQFQYRGIENPFGETWTFEHGIQVYNDAALASIKVNNVVYTRDPSMDGPASRAFVHEGEYRWVGLTLPSNVHAFLDADLTQDSGYVASAYAYLKYHNGYWETLDTDAYTMTAQQTAANPAYTWRAFPWATAGNGWVKQFDPVTFFAITLGGGASTYLCDYYWTTTSGSRVVYVGGTANNGSGDGMAYRSVAYGLTNAAVSISGRLSAGRGDA